MTDELKGHDPKLVAALLTLKAELEAMPEGLRGPFVVKGLAPYATTPAQTKGDDLVRYSVLSGGYMVAADGSELMDRSVGAWVRYSKAITRIQSLTASNRALADERDDVVSLGQDLARRLSEAEASNEALERENNHLTSSGVIEVAIRNPSVSDYMSHWEGRAEAAETALQASQAEIARMREALEHWRDTAHEQNGLAMGHEEALQTAQAEIAELKEAATLSAMYLKTGFIECGRCGHEVETKNTDAEYTLREALTPQEPT